MRDSLTVLAILLIGVLTAALVVPYAIDWDSHRALIERELSDAAGAPVAVAGPIDLKILPKPVLRLGGIAVGGGDGGRPRLAAASLDAELSFAALLRGQVQVVDTTLVGPRLDLVQAADGGFGLTLPTAPSADRVSFDHLGIRGGSVSLRLADGRRAELGGIDLDGEAASLRGPFKAAGRAGDVGFRLGTGALDGGRLRLKLHLDGAGARPALDLDGAVSARPGALGPGFDGTAAAAGEVALDGTPAAVPWRATARLSADRGGAKLADAEVRAGADLRALIASGEGEAAFPAGGGAPRAALHLHGAVLDLDALAVAPADSGLAPPQGLDLLWSALRRAGDGAADPPLRLDLDAAFDTATLAGRTALGLRAGLGLGGGPGAALTLAADGPNGARVALDGRLDPGPAPPVAGPFGAAPAAAGATFRGRAEARSDDASRTAAWLRPIAPGFAAALAAALPGRRVSASAGSVAISAAGLEARGADLRIDGSTLSGALSFAPASGAAPARLGADLAAEALDLGALPDLSGAAAAARGIDLDLTLAARAASLTPASLGPVAAGDLALRLSKRGDAVRLDRLAVSVEGARLDASGSADADGARGELRIAAAQFGPLGDALAPLLPGPAAAALRARAALLSPVDVTLRAEAGPGGYEPTRLALSGTAGGARVEADLRPDGPAAGRDAASRPVALSLRAEAPEAAALLRLLGAPAAVPIAGPARVEASGKGTLADGLAGTAELAVGGTALSYAGRAGPAGGAGRLALRSPDLRPLLPGLGLPAPPSAFPAEAGGDLDWDGSAARWRGVAGAVAGVKASGELSLDLAGRRGPDGAPAPALRGRVDLDRLPAEALLGLALGPPSPAPPGAAWSPAPFAAAPALPRAELAVTAAAMPLRGGLDARGVSLTLRTAPGSLSVADLSGQADGGSFGGALALRRDAAAAALTGRLAFDGLALDAGGLRARASGSAEIVGSGASPAALAASLAGTGAVSLSGAALERTDPGAPARVLALATARDAAADLGNPSAAPTPPDAEALRRDLAAALDRGPLAIGDARAPANLAGGVLRVGPLRQSGASPPPTARGAAAPLPWAAETSFALDLSSFAASTRTAIGPAPGRTEAVVSRSGPLGGPATREVDASGLVEAVQEAAAARAQARIDLFEQDVRERAAFERVRRASEQQRQMERERAEAERQAAAEAQRVAAEAQRAAAARAAAEAQARAAAARAAAQAAAEAQKAAAAEAARQKAEDDRVQAQVQAAARVEAEKARAEAEKQRFIDRVLRDGAPPDERRERGRGADPLDPPPPPSIMREGR